ncbi:DUF2470 domain-containing protein [Actinospongicola halichondriae]|uniref:DUF2470 domain-containing protein n=1 Tax=Actinospongicola halichondriae TaxID=3236844 RepID=UPI003D5316E5
MADDFLTDDVVRAVAHHMNTDHADDNAIICRGVGGQPDVLRAEMTGLDLAAIEFRAETDSGPVDLRIDFAERLVDRAQIRAEVARMFHESVALLDS